MSVYKMETIPVKFLNEITSSDARFLFKEKLGDISPKGWFQLTDSDIYLIAGYIAKYLAMHETDNPNVHYEIGKISIRRAANGIIQMADIRVNQIINGCSGWEERQAITFEESGFIGFCGWASTSNLKPFIDGFMEWLRRKER